LSEPAKKIITEFRFTVNCFFENMKIYFPDAGAKRSIMALFTL